MRTCASLWSLLIVSVTVTLSAQAPRLSFEVASVRYRGDQPLFIPPTRTPPNIFYRSGETVEFLVRLAYGVQKFQVTGGPDWVRKNFYEINARIAADSSPDQIPLMLRSLLEDRFKLVIRQEQRDMRFLALVAAREDRRLGPQIARCDPANLPPPKAVPLPRGGMIAFGTCKPISDIAAVGTGVTGEPVIDRTGLTGLWNFELAYERQSRAIAGEPAEVPPLPVALQEQLGLKLESTRGPVDVVVIESVQPPTEN